MAELCYNLLLPLTLPWVRLRLWWRGLKEPGYRTGLAERFGRLSFAPLPRGIWMHTVSAGEAIAAVPLIRKLILDYPQFSVLVTTMTPTGSAALHQQLGERVEHCYAPYDYSWVVERFLARVQPKLIVLMETELWPNWIRCAQRHNIPVLLVNARLSEKSARGYRRLGSLSRRMMGRLTWVGCQTAAHARRFERLGVDRKRLTICGNLKFDLEIPIDLARHAMQLRERWQLPQSPERGGLATSPRPIWVAASTHAGEEQILLQAHQKLLQRYPGLLLILVPRHPLRAPAVAKLTQQSGLSGALFSAETSSTTAVSRPAQVVIADRMGQLLLCYQAADVAFIGGSLVPWGGHNMIEAAASGLPLVMGNSDYNFEGVVTLFHAAGCLERIASAAALAEVLERWFADPNLRQRIGARARAVVTENAGATARLLQQIGLRLPA